MEQCNVRGWFRSRGGLAVHNCRPDQANFARGRKTAAKQKEGRKACVCVCPPFFSVAAGALNVKCGHVGK